MGLLDEAIREHLELKRRRGADAGEISRAESEALAPVRRAADGTPDIASIPGAPLPAPAPQGFDAPVPGQGPQPDRQDETAILPGRDPGAAQAAPAHQPSPEPPAPAYQQPPEPPAPGYQPPPEPPAPAYQPPPAPPAPAPQPAAYEPPTAPAVPHDPGYTMPPALRPADHDEHPPGFEDLDEDPIEPPPAQPPREKRGLRLRLRRHADDDERPPEPLSQTFDDADDPFDAPREPPPAYTPPTATYTPTPRPYQPPPPPRDPASAGDEPAGEDLLEETPEFLEETPDHDRLWFEQRPPRDFDFDK